MIAAIESNDIKPVVSDHFPLNQLQQAFELQAAQKHFGKIVVTL